MTPQHKSILAILALAFAVVPLAGCMIGEISHTIYLEADGTMTWVVAESRMRSAEGDPGDRRRDEDDWLTARSAERHHPAEAFWELGASQVETHLLRDRRPFDVVTRAAFDDPIDAFERLFDAAGLVGVIEVERRAAGGAITVRIDVEATEQSGLDPTPAIDGLLRGDAFRVMVGDGSFVEAVGFSIDGDLARLDGEEIEAALEEDPATLVLSLGWELGSGV